MTDIELDTKIALMMGWTLVNDGKTAVSPAGDIHAHWTGSRPSWLPFYTSDMNLACEVMDKYGLTLAASADPDGSWVCYKIESPELYSVANTPALAVCRYFLGDPFDNV